MFQHRPGAAGAATSFLSFLDFEMLGDSKISTEQRDVNHLVVVLGRLLFFFSSTFTLYLLERLAHPFVALPLEDNSRRFRAPGLLHIHVSMRCFATRSWERDSPRIGTVSSQFTNAARSLTSIFKSVERICFGLFCLMRWSMPRDIASRKYSFLLKRITGRRSWYLLIDSFELKVL
jgi:hypothetical protein